MAPKPFKCTICDKIVESTHCHRVNESYQHKLERATGKIVKIGDRVCCGHFENHAYERFTKHQTPEVVKEFNRPDFVSPSTRKSKAINRPPPQQPAPLSKRGKVTESRVQELEAEVAFLQDQLNRQREPFLSRLIQLDEGLGPLTRT